MSDAVTPTIDEAFVRQYEKEVHNYYQRQGSKLRDTVRNRKGVVGKSTTFQSYGQAKATQKTRGGNVQRSNPKHEPKEVVLQDWYVQISVDELDLLKISHDEREAIVRAGAAALGQKTDELIIGALAKTTRNVGNYGTGLDNATLELGIETYFETDVPEDGQSYAALSNHAFREFKNISKVSSADFAGEMYPFLKGRKAFNWEEIIWQQHTGLPLANDDDRDNFIYHKSAVAFASGAEITTNWWFDGNAQAWLCTMKMSGGADLIDERGAVKLRLDDDTPITND